MYEEAALRSLDRQCGGGSWPDSARQPTVPDVARPYVDGVPDGDAGDGGVWI